MGTTITPGSRSHLFVMNPRSFENNRALEKIAEDAIKRAVSNLAADDYIIHYSRFSRDAIAVIRGKHAEMQRENAKLPDASKKKTLRIYAVGGDGIFFDCLNGAYDLPDIELATVPYGAHNDLVRAFGEGKKGLFRDIEAQMTAGTVPCDVVSSANNVAIMTFSVGIESTTMIRSRQFRDFVKEIIGFEPALLVRNSFYIGGLLALSDKDTLANKYDLAIDGEDFSGHYTNILVSNCSSYGGNLGAVSVAMPDDGYFDVLMMKSVSAFKGAMILNSYTHWNWEKYRDLFIYRRAKKLTVASKNYISVNMDGEVFYERSYSVEIVPRAVNIVAPGDSRFLDRSAAGNARRVKR